MSRYRGLSNEPFRGRFFPTLAEILNARSSCKAVSGVVAVFPLTIAAAGPAGRDPARRPRGVGARHTPPMPRWFVLPSENRCPRSSPLTTTTSRPIAFGGGRGFAFCLRDSPLLLEQAAARGTADGPRLLRPGAGKSIPATPSPGAIGLAGLLSDGTPRSGPALGGSPAGDVSMEVTVDRRTPTSSSRRSARRSFRPSDRSASAR